jgi:hypothetical protein
MITYSPDEAGLKVYYELGRWIMTWMRLEVSADIPEEFRRELLLVEEVPTAPRPAFSCPRSTDAPPPMQSDRGPAMVAVPGSPQRAPEGPPSRLDLAQVRGLETAKRGPGAREII